MYLHKYFLNNDVRNTYYVGISKYSSLLALLKLLNLLRILSYGNKSKRADCSLLKTNGTFCVNINSINLFKYLSQGRIILLVFPKRSYMAFNKNLVNSWIRPIGKKLSGLLSFDLDSSKTKVRSLLWPSSRKTFKVP